MMANIFVSHQGGKRITREESYFDYTDWSQYEFNGIPAP